MNQDKNKSIPSEDLYEEAQMPYNPSMEKEKKKKEKLDKPIETIIGIATPEDDEKYKHHKFPAITPP